jgi:DNA invertase Pin-like site-specific DNA recombinase
VTRLDRLARSVRDLTNITSDLQTKQVSFVVLDQQIDTTTPTGKLLFHVLSAIGEFERELINERIRDGIVRAKKAGVKF